MGLHCVADANKRELAGDATADVAAKLMIETRPKNKTVTERTESLTLISEICVIYYFFK